MPRFFQIRPDARVRDLTHSSRLTKNDRTALTEAFGKNPIKAFALHAVHPSLKSSTNAEGRVTSRTLWTLKVKSKAVIDGALLRYEMSDSVIFLDETRNLFYASAKATTDFLTALSQRAERTLLPKKNKRKKAADLLLRVAFELLSNVTQDTRRAVDAALKTWNGNDVDRRILEHALEVHAELCQSKRNADDTGLIIAVGNEGASIKRIPKHLRREYKRMCVTVSKQLKVQTKETNRPPNLL